MMASKGWKMVQPHIPMIRFRKGEINKASAAMTAPSSRAGPSMAQQTAQRATGPGVISLPPIDDIHLPPRYQRPPLDDREIEYINRGGPA